MTKKVAIVDYGMGNIFSVKHACESVGLRADITSSREEILAAPAVILPGVGAFGDAMTTLHRLDLVSVLQDVAAMGRPLVGVCLGLQLLMSESCEFGHHKGLGIIPGEVLPLRPSNAAARRFKVPQVQWNEVRRANDRSWGGTLLHGISENSYLYFVHSFYAKPAADDVSLSVTTYGSEEFCSSVESRNVFACQFHPERSGSVGLKVYENLASRIATK